MLAGCIFAERTDVVLDIPPGYRAGRGVSAPPALDWWRGFGTRELTRLIEEAQTFNLDIAAAIARIMQADALSKIAGAPLLPTLDFLGTATRSKPAGGLERDELPRAAHRRLRDRFLGQEPRRLARRPGNRRRHPLRQGSGGAQHHRGGRQRLFPGRRRAGAAAHRAREPRRRLPRAHPDQEPVQRRHRLAARCVPAGEPGGDGARRHPAARPDLAPEHRRAGRAGRTRARGFHREGRQPLQHAHSGGDAGAAVGPAVPAPRHSRRRGQSRRRRRQRRIRPRRLLPAHLADSGRAATRAKP